MMDVEALVDGQVFQIAFVVRDLDAASPGTHGSSAARRGGSSRSRRRSIARPCTAAARRTSPSAGPNGTSPQYELIEPERGPGVHEDWLDEHGEGFHHVGVIVDSVDATVARMAAAGYDAIQTGAGFGAAGDGRYAYFDTARDLGFLIEAVEPPERMPDPDRIWP